MDLKQSLENREQLGGLHRWPAKEAQQVGEGLLLCVRLSNHAVHVGLHQQTSYFNQAGRQAGRVEHHKADDATTCSVTPTMQPAYRCRDEHILDLGAGRCRPRWGRVGGSRSLRSSKALSDLSRKQLGGAHLRLHQLHVCVNSIEGHFGST
jgi:hypothetical protein